MLRLALACALLGALVTAPAGSAAEPTPVEKQLAVQSAIEAARNHLDAHRTAEAVTALEREVPMTSWLTDRAAATPLPMSPVAPTSRTFMVLLTWGALSLVTRAQRSAG